MGLFYAEITSRKSPTIIATIYSVGCFKDFHCNVETAANHVERLRNSYLRESSVATGKSRFRNVLSGRKVTRFTKLSTKCTIQNAFSVTKVMPNKQTIRKRQGRCGESREGSPTSASSVSSAQINPAVSWHRQAQPPWRCRVIAERNRHSDGSWCQPAPLRVQFRLLAVKKPLRELMDFVSQDETQMRDCKALSCLQLRNREIIPPCALLFAETLCCTLESKSRLRRSPSPSKCVASHGQLRSDLKPRNVYTHSKASSMWLSQCI